MVRNVEIANIARVFTVAEQLTDNLRLGFAPQPAVIESLCLPESDDALDRPAGRYRPIT